MAVSPAPNSSTLEVTTPSHEQIRLSRTFNAPRALVFEAMSRPEYVRQWWGNLGEGYSVPVCEIDFRVGGAWRFVNRHPKGDAVFYGVYREIQAPSRIVFTEIYEPFPDVVSIVTSELIEEGNTTRMIATISYPSLEVRDMVMATGMAKGAGTSYDRLEDLLATLQAR